jgi:hypothetical protein
MFGSKQSTWRCTVGRPRFIRASSSRDATPPSIRSTWHMSTQTASRRSKSSKCGPPRPAQGRVATAPSKRSLPDNDTSASSQSDQYPGRRAQAQGKRSGAWAETQQAASGERQRFGGGLARLNEGGFGVCDQHCVQRRAGWRLVRPLGGGRGQRRILAACLRFRCRACGVLASDGEKMYWGSEEMGEGGAISNCLLLAGLHDALSGACGYRQPLQHIMIHGAVHAVLSASALAPRRRRQASPSPSHWPSETSSAVPSPWLWLWCREPSPRPSPKVLRGHFACNHSLVSPEGKPASL